MFYLIIVLFVLGYTAIALERRLSVDKTAIALATGVLIWVCIAFGGDTIYPELAGHLGKISGILFFLFGTMTIVEIIDSHGGFGLLSKFIKTTDRAKLLWIFSFLTFFMSAVLGNLTTTVVMLTLMWKLVGGKSIRWIFASMIVIAANAGGAWSPIGDITTVILWMGGHVSEWNIILQLFVPSLICMLVPLVVLSLNMKGETNIPSSADLTKSLIPTTDRERWIVLLSGIVGLMLVPVFKSVLQLPPYMGVLLVLAILWMVTRILHRKKHEEFRIRLTFTEIFKKADTSTIFFFLGILLAVAGLESAGHLNLLGHFLDEKVHNILAINLVIGALSSVIDNVPLVAGTMGMYDIVLPDALTSITDPVKVAWLKHFVADGFFWELLTYCTGNGGSILLIGSTTGIAAMGLTQIDFVWYLKKISFLVLIGYLSGFAAYLLIR